MGFIWKFVPRLESCEMLCRGIDIICPCRSKRSHSPEDHVAQIVASTQSITSVRRISRIRSEDSLDDDASPDRDEEIDEVTSLSSSAPSSSSGMRISKKISLRRIATKALKMSHSSGDGANHSDDGSLDDDFKNRHFNKSASKSSPIPEGETKSPEMELKEKFKSMLRESRKTFKENRGKQQLLFPFTSINALPPHTALGKEGLLDASRDDSPHQLRQQRGGYGTIQTTPPYRKEVEGEGAISEGDDWENSIGEKYAQSSGQNNENISMQETDLKVPVPASTHANRGEADGSSMEEGSMENPTLECFGSITAAVKFVSSKIVTYEDPFPNNGTYATGIRVSQRNLLPVTDSQHIVFHSRFITLSPRRISVKIVSLQGIPCRQGKDNGLCLELKVDPSGSSIWLPLPLAHGSKASVNSDVSMKLPSATQAFPSISSRQDQQHYVQIRLWVAGRTWKHCSIGNAVIKLSEASEVPSIIGLHQHSKLTNSIGVLEVGLTSSTEDSSKKSSSSPNVTLTIQILKAKFNKDLTLGKSITAIRQFKRSKRDIWCRISLWNKGRRVERVVSPRIYLPVTNDPVFRITSIFSIQRHAIPYSSIVVKILCDRGLGEEVLGKLILGPHLYLGVLKGTSPPTALSHWGKALTHAGTSVMWHQLYL